MLDVHKLVQNLVLPEQMMKAVPLPGYLRADGCKGIRNTILVVYLVECAHFVASKIVAGFDAEDVQLIGFPGCYPNEYAV